LRRFPLKPFSAYFATASPALYAFSWLSIAENGLRGKRLNAYRTTPKDREIADATIDAWYDKELEDGPVDAEGLEQFMERLMGNEEGGSWKQEIPGEYKQTFVKAVMETNGVLRRKEIVGTPNWELIIEGDESFLRSINGYLSCAVSGVTGELEDERLQYNQSRDILDVLERFYDWDTAVGGRAPTILDDVTEEHGIEIE
jgi:hypothetical protein